MKECASASFFCNGSRFVSKFSKALKPVIDYARKYGWNIERARCGHVRLVNSDNITVFAPLTPSDNRSVKNVLTKLRRADAGYRTAFQGGNS